MELRMKYVKFQTICFTYHLFSVRFESKRFIRETSAVTCPCLYGVIVIIAIVVEVVFLSIVPNGIGMRCVCLSDANTISFRNFA